MNFLSRFLKKQKIKSLTKQIGELAKKREQGQGGDRDHEVALFLTLGHFYLKHQHGLKLTHGELLAQESFRGAASLDSAEGQYLCGKLLLEQGKFWKKLQSGIFSTGIQKRYAENAFQEAFQFLNAAEEQEHPLATRLHGMALIHGWGVETDKHQGYDRVIKSISLENSWETANDTFKSLGLNTPEFYAALNQRGKSI